jgi:hypothetical protein
LITAASYSSRNSARLVAIGFLLYISYISLSQSMKDSYLDGRILFADILLSGFLLNVGKLCLQEHNPVNYGLDLQAMALEFSILLFL